MKTSNCLFVAALLVTNALFGQKNTIANYFTLQPSEISNKSTDRQEYKVTLKWQNLDAINGNKLNCNQVNATYTVGLNNGYVAWKNVSLGPIDDFKQTSNKGTELPSFNNFTYKGTNTDFLKEDFYKDIPADQRDLAKWLVSDAIQMQGIAWYVFDSLSFNKEFSPIFLKNYDIKFENWVTFTSRYQKLIWSGITRCNNEICAIVKFESLYNPLEMNNSEMSLKGRSLYWGEIWISLEDKQVEYASMVEDVVLKLKMASLPQEQLIDLQRVVLFEKVQ